MRAQRRQFFPYVISCALVPIILAAVATLALAQVSPALRGKALDPAILTAKAADPEGVRVFVTLRAATASNPPAASSSTEAPSSPAFGGPLGDGQSATVEQARILAIHLGPDPTKRQRWSPRLIANTPYMAMTVTLPELEALAADPDVVSLHEDGQLRPGLQDSAPLIGMGSAFGFGATGANSMVAVLDTGVEYGHVFLSPRVTNATCFSTTSATFTTLCPNGQGTQIGGTGGQNCSVAGCAHGTHVAGIAAGNRASGTPLNGVAKAATILAGQVFSRRNSDNALIAFDSDMVASLNDILTRVSPGGELASRNLAAINLSIWDVGLQVAGTCDTGRGAPFKTVIDALKAQRVATVIISGNNAQRNLSAFPGCVSSAVTVGATSKTDAVASYSNISAVVDLLAPGGESTTTATQITSSIPTSTFGGMQGTSMAAPHVAGAFSAIRSACTTLTVDQIETALKNTGLSVTDTRSGGSHTKPRIRVALALQQLACASGSLQTVSHDFKGDGRSDMAWRQNAGAVAIWMMNGLQVMQSGGIGSVAPIWTIVGQRDFDGNGKHDLVWRDNGGNTAIWFLDGTTVASSASLGNVPTTWSLVGTGDFNLDGKGDLLWRAGNGTTAIWLMNGATVLQASAIGNVSSNWTVAGLADFNGDGKADILWREVGGGSGVTAIWFMTGTAVLSAASVATVPLGWTIVGTGDFNGDNRSDILWRDAAGNVAIWLMNGVTILQAASLGLIPASWAIQMTGDFNGDGKSDILWRDAAGNTAIWFMNGATVSSSGVVATVGNDWIIQRTNAN